MRSSLSVCVGTATPPPQGHQALVTCHLPAPQPLHLLEHTCYSSQCCSCVRSLRLPRGFHHPRPLLDVAFLPHHRDHGPGRQWAWGAPDHLPLERCYHWDPVTHLLSLLSLHLWLHLVCLCPVGPACHVQEMGVGRGDHVCVAQRRVPTQEP